MEGERKRERVGGREDEKEKERERERDLPMLTVVREISWPFTEITLTYLCILNMFIISSRFNRKAFFSARKSPCSAFVKASSL